VDLKGGIVIPGKFRESGPRARFADELTRVITPYLNEMGWECVCNDLLSYAGGLIAMSSSKPAQDLQIAGGYLRKINWRAQKRRWFAAQQGVRPEDVQVDDEGNATVAAPSEPEPG
jgi:hypothetical protein